MTYTVESSDVIRDDLCWCSFVTFNTTIISSFFVTYNPKILLMIFVSVPELRKALQKPVGQSTLRVKLDLIL